MLIEKKGFKSNTGKTTEALKLVIKLIKEGNMVLYVTEELTHDEVNSKLFMLDNFNDVDFENTMRNFLGLHAQKDEIKEALEVGIPVSTVIIFDILSAVEDDFVENDFYVFYQLNANESTEK